MISNELVKIACEYYKQGNSLKETAKFLESVHNFSIHQNTLSHHLKKTGLDLRNDTEALILRTRKHIDISKIVEEYAKFSSIRDISRKFGIERATVRKILKENGVQIKDSRSALLSIGHIKEKPKIILSDYDKAYIYGMVMGDLTPVRKSDYTLKLITHSTHKCFIDLLIKIFKDYGVTNYKETKHNSYRFTTYLDLESFSFLLSSKTDLIPGWTNSNNFFDFLAGFIDSDGSVMLKKGGKCGQNIFYGLRLFGQNLDLLNQVKERLKKLGYNSSVHLSHRKGFTHYRNGIMFRYNKDYYTLETRKSETIELLNKIPIRHPEKIMKRELIFKIDRLNLKKWNEIGREVERLRGLIKSIR